MREEARLKSHIRKKIYDELEMSGFRRYSKEGVDLPLNGEFNCWVGLNAGVYDGLVQINPFVGVHAVPIEKLVSSIKGRKYDRGIATYAVAMGELDAAKDERAFAFTLDQSEEFVEAEVSRISTLYSEVGIPFSDSISSYEDLLPLLENKVNMLGGFPESFACCLYLMGRKDEARHFAEKFAMSEPEFFGPFSAAFLNKIEGS